MKKTIQLIPCLMVMLSLGLMSGCSSMFNSRTQIVTISRQNPASRVLLNGEEISFQNNVAEVQLERDFTSKQIVCELEGYQPEYMAIGQNKGSKTKFLNLGPTAFFTIVAATSLEASSLPGPSFVGMSFLTSLPISGLFAGLDRNKKSKDYPKQIEVPAPKRPLIVRQEQERYLFASEIGFDLEEQAFNFYGGTQKKYLKGRLERKPFISNDSALVIENSIFTRAINGFLYGSSFSDTSRNVLKTKSNTLYLSAKIQEVKVYTVRTINKASTTSIIGPKFFTTSITSVWQLEDIYGQSLFSLETEGKSGEFSLGANEPRRALDLSVEDAIESSLLTLLSNEEVKKLLTKGNNTVEKESSDILSLTPPSQVPRDLESAAKATVVVKVDGGHGSGFFINQDGFVLTNFHVVANTDTLIIIDQAGKEYEGVLITKDFDNDLALIKIESTPPYAFQIPSSINYQLGTSIYAIGTPGSLEIGQSISSGIVSGERQVDKATFLQTDASINFGNSGGPLVNQEGELIGIVNSKLIGIGVEGIAFGTPAYLLSQYLNLSFK